jgi:hypothetical protein
MKYEMREMEGLEDFHEAAWVFKRGGLYYLTYADNLEVNNRMRYATSEHPLGPWTYRGIFLEPTGCSTTHGSVAEFKGQWYLFYHSIDYLYFNEDGTIQTVVQTKEGVKSVGVAPIPKPNQRTYSAEKCSLGGGAKIEINEQRKSVVNHLHSVGSFCQFDHIDGEKGGRASIQIRYATAERLAKLNLTVNDSDYLLLNALSTGSPSHFTGCASITVQLKPGNDNIIRFAGGNNEISLESITVTPFID